MDFNKNLIKSVQFRENGDHDTQFSQTQRKYWKLPCKCAKNRLKMEKLREGNSVKQSSPP